MGPFFLPPSPDNSFRNTFMFRRIHCKDESGSAISNVTGNQTLYNWKKKKKKWPEEWDAASLSPHERVGKNISFIKSSCFFRNEVTSIYFQRIKLPLGKLINVHIDFGSPESFESSTFCQFLRSFSYIFVFCADIYFFPLF